MTDGTDNTNDINETDEEFETAIGEVLGQEPRAYELRQMIGALHLRRTALMRDLDTADETDRQQFRQTLADLDEKIAVLEEEVGITKFIEDAVRFTVEVQKLESS